MTRIPAPGPHGGDGPAVAAALGLRPSEVLDLSVSLNPAAPDVKRAIARHIDSVDHYPDRSRATTALADAMSIEEDRLLLTNGGAEAIRLVADEIGGRVHEPEFSLHPRDHDTSSPLWRSNPHSPSGLLAPDTERADVWDEAFYPLATGSWTRGDEGAVVVGSLTKLLACPGLRIGYLIGTPELVDSCERRQPRWSVNALASSALPEILEAVDLAAWSKKIRELRELLFAVLSKHGLEPWPSDANWVLVESPGLRDKLARRGVVVRDCSSFSLPTVVRVAVPSEEGLARLDEALRDISAAPGSS